MLLADDRFDAIVIGGGPAGSAIGRLLAVWGHRVVIVAHSRPLDRGMAESIPPSTGKLLAEIGVLDAVTGAGFVPNRGNVVWWGANEGRSEDVGDGAASGFHVYRPRFDALLLAQAEHAGAEVRRGAIARRVDLDPSFDDVRVTVEHGGRRFVLAGSFAIDCSGRAGVLARRGYRMYEPHHRMQAFVGMWRRPGGFPGGIHDRTIIESYDDGWAWSLPLDDRVRQVAMMVDGATTSTLRGPTIADTYRAELAKTRRLRALVCDAALDYAWACDASMYSARAFAGSQVILVGDAATCIDPLSSFGVKKALSSAWLGAVAVHTALVDRGRRSLAFEFFSAREREVYAAELGRTRTFAQRALAQHNHPFWRARSADPSLTPEQAEVDRLLRGVGVQAAYARLRATASVALGWRRREMVKAPRVRGHEIVLDDALPIGASAVRFAAGVDLVALGRAAVAHEGVPAIYDAYCRSSAPVALPSMLAALSLLIAEGILE